MEPEVLVLGGMINSLIPFQKLDLYLQRQTLMSGCDHPQMVTAMSNIAVYVDALAIATKDQAKIFKTLIQDTTSSSNVMVHLSITLDVHTNETQMAP